MVPESSLSRAPQNYIPIEFILFPGFVVPCAETQECRNKHNLGLSQVKDSAIRVYQLKIVSLGDPQSSVDVFVAVGIQAQLNLTQLRRFP
jgi:hypothetical protein